MDKEKLISSIEKDLVLLEKESKISFDEIITILNKRKEDRKNKTLPVSIFNKELSSLETIVKYLKENLGLNYKEIAFLLNRNYNPIAITYRKSKIKFSKRLDDSSEKKIPVEIFRNAKLSVLENLVAYLKENLMLNYRQIAILLHRDERTVWTVYQRALKKKR